MNYTDIALDSPYFPSENLFAVLHASAAEDQEIPTLAVEMHLKKLYICTSYPEIQGICGGSGDGGARYS